MSLTHCCSGHHVHMCETICGAHTLRTKELLHMLITVLSKVVVTNWTPLVYEAFLLGHTHPHSGLFTSLAAASLKNLNGPYCFIYSYVCASVQRLLSVLSCFSSSASVQFSLLGNSLAYFSAHSEFLFCEMLVYWPISTGFLISGLCIFRT